MRLTVTTFTTLDGVMQAPGGADEDRSGGFAHGGWLVPFFDDDLGQFMDATFAQADAILLGRTTYDMMQLYWSTVTDSDNVVGLALNALTKHVATHRPDSLAVGQYHLHRRRHRCLRTGRSTRHPRDVRGRGWQGSGSLRV